MWLPGYFETSYFVMVSNLNITMNRLKSYVAQSDARSSFLFRKVKRCHIPCNLYLKILKGLYCFFMK